MIVNKHETAQAMNYIDIIIETNSLFAVVATQEQMSLHSVYSERFKCLLYDITLTFDIIYYLHVNGCACVCVCCV